VKSRRMKWIGRIGRPKRGPVTVHQLLQARRREFRSRAHVARHIRQVSRFGDDGLRCFECRDVPLHPWEPVYPRDEWGMTYGEAL
jgi:hypothetical protein